MAMPDHHDKKDIKASSTDMTNRDSGRFTTPVPTIQNPTQAQITARDAGRS